MGQYYYPVNLDKEQYMDPHSYYHGLKLMEHSYIGNDFVETVASLFMPGNTWYKDRLVWAGDYMDNGLFIDTHSPKYLNLRQYVSDDDEIEHINLHALASKVFEKIQPPVVKRSARFIVGHDLKQYVDIKHLPVSMYDYIIHPLPLLTCSGNGRGGGDYDTHAQGSVELVGIWAGHSISVEDKAPAGYQEILPKFKEEWQWATI